MGDYLSENNVTVRLGSHEVAEIWSHLREPGDGDKPDCQPKYMSDPMGTLIRSVLEEAIIVAPETVELDLSAGMWPYEPRLAAPEMILVVNKDIVSSVATALSALPNSPAAWVAADTLLFCQQADDTLSEF